MRHAKSLRLDDIGKKTRSRFLSKVHRGGYADDCWTWEGTLLRGRGVFSYRRHNVASHRFAYAMLVGEIPDGMCVCHHYDNPRCVNPDHLFLGSQADNIADMVGKRRVARGERHGLAKLSKLAVLAIRTYYRIGIPQDFIARRFFVTSSNISAIVTRRSWSHVA